VRAPCAAAPTLPDAASITMHASATRPAAAPCATDGDWREGIRKTLAPEAVVRMTPRHRRGVRYAAVVGKVIVTRVPPSVPAAIAIRAPCASAIQRAIASPSPAPVVVPRTDSAR